MICSQCGQENPDGFRFCGSCGAAFAEAPPPREVRKTVTVLFCDVSGSTALGERTDPEALRHVMRRYFDEIRAAIERHGGTVEKFIGDAAMAVFGVPQVREDDALRAVRAADEIRARLPRLAGELGVELTFRTGINTGEVVVGEGQTLATGDAVNVAARLEQAAEPGEILLGVETRRLVRDAVEVEPVEPLALKGKARPVEAFRLVRVDPDAPALARRLDAPLVGRERELELLRRAFERSVSERSCSLVTVLGAAGVGKSRLVAELLAGIAGEARVVVGRCLHYGEGITFSPLVEALKQLGPAAEPALERILGGGAAPAELFWEVRKLLEREAQERPLVAVFDDLQWAEPMFLDLLDHVADLSREAPILLLCVGRPELLDERPGWGGGKLNATTTLLEPLSADEAERLLEALGDGLDEDARRRIVEASEGNPLFVEEMAALAREQGDVTVPSTIQALLAARLERLAGDERAVIERGAVEGKVFHSGAVRELAPEPVRPDVEAHLAALVRKELIRPERGPFAEDDAFRFRHLLIRDAAYEALPKEVRAELHARFADWLEEHGDELVERDELVGYHLEQAIRYRRELGAEPEPGLAERGARSLADAADRAFHRTDLAAARGLYGRAAALAPPGRERALLQVRLAYVLTRRGEFDAAASALGEAETEPDELVRAHARTGRLALALSTDADSLDETEIRAVIATLERLGDEDGVARGWQLLGGWYWLQCRAAPAREAFLNAARHAAATHALPLAEVVHPAAAAMGIGPFPYDDVETSIRECDQLPAGPVRDAAIAGGRLFQAMLAGRYDEARSYWEAAKAAQRECGLEVIVIAGVQLFGQLAIRAGWLDEGEARLRESIEGLERLGERSYLPTNMAVLADVLLAQGRHEEAEALTHRVEELSAALDAINFSEARRIRSEALLARGEVERAVELGTKAVTAADVTDFPLFRANARLSLARALAAQARAGEATAVLQEAIDLYALKGDLWSLARARALLAELEPAPAP